MWISLLILVAYKIENVGLAWCSRPLVFLSDFPEFLELFVFTFSNIFISTFLNMLRQFPPHGTMIVSQIRYASSNGKTKINRVLIANRGEIAMRVMRTAKRLGIETVAVFSDADVNALHAKTADKAYRIGEASPLKSYLKMDTIIDVALKSGAQVSSYIDLYFPHCSHIYYYYYCYFTLSGYSSWLRFLERESGIR